MHCYLKFFFKKLKESCLQQPTFFFFFLWELWLWILRTTLITCQGYVPLCNNRPTRKRMHNALLGYLPSSINLPTFLFRISLLALFFWKKSFYFYILNFHLGTMFLFLKKTIHFIFAFWNVTLEPCFNFWKKIHFIFTFWNFTLETCFNYGKIHFIFSFWNFTLKPCFNIWKSILFFHFEISPRNHVLISWKSILFLHFEISP
jgi:hypothetical protein